MKSQYSSPRWQLLGFFFRVIYYILCSTRLQTPLGPFSPHSQYVIVAHLVGEYHIWSQDLFR